MGLLVMWCITVPLLLLNLVFWQQYMLLHTQSVEAAF